MGILGKIDRISRTHQTVVQICWALRCFCCSSMRFMDIQLLHAKMETQTPRTLWLVPVCFRWIRKDSYKVHCWLKHHNWQPPQSLLVTVWKGSKELLHLQTALSQKEEGREKEQGKRGERN